MCNSIWNHVNLSHCCHMERSSIWQPIYFSVEDILWSFFMHNKCTLHVTVQSLSHGNCATLHWKNLTCVWFNSAWPLHYIYLNQYRCDKYIFIHLVKCVKNVKLLISTNSYFTYRFEYGNCSFMINPCTASIKCNHICGEMAHCHSTMSLQLSE